MPLLIFFQKISGCGRSMAKSDHTVPNGQRENGFCNRGSREDTMQGQQETGIVF